MAAFLRRRLRGIATAWTAPCGPAKPLLALARRRGHHPLNKTREDTMAEPYSDILCRVENRRALSPRLRPGAVLSTPAP